MARKARSDAMLKSFLTNYLFPEVRSVDASVTTFYLDQSCAAQTEQFCRYQGEFLHASCWDLVPFGGS